MIYQVEDAESGIKTEEAILDNKHWTQDQIDLFYQALGNHDFMVRAVDRAGNTAVSTVSFRVIATLDSLASDINRAYSLGWIKNKLTKDAFLKIVAMAKPLYDKYQGLKQTRPVLADLIKAQLLAVLSSWEKTFVYYENRGYLTHEAAVLLWQQVSFIIKNL
jgi:hypothetical protein